MSRPDTVPADIAGALGRAGTRLGLFGARLLWYDEIGSTNDTASRLADAGAAAGTVVAANAQTSGRGRLGRTWVSPPGAGLYFSVVLRPEMHVVPMLTLAAGVAVADGIEAATGLTTTLKWPNDVQAGGRKLAGILAEGGAFVIVGIGINVRAAAYPPDIATRATSLEQELGRDVDRGLVLAECLAALNARSAELYAAGGASAIVAAWKRRAAPMWGRAVEWDSGRGVAEGVASDGALLVRTARGVERILSGEVRWT
ncbi:MAG: biotin--[acetyl-CoA-carboxylase] ligase [Vicinamibacterales bacterium]